MALLSKSIATITKTYLNFLNIFISLDDKNIFLFSFYIKKNNRCSLKMPGFQKKYNCDLGGF